MSLLLHPHPKTSVRIIIIIIIIIIVFMHGICNYIPAGNLFLGHIVLQKLFCIYNLWYNVVVKITTIIINIIILVFMQVIYNNTWNKPVSRVHSVAAVLYLQFLLPVTLFRTWNMFSILKLALPAVCVCSVQYGCFFCSSLISCFPHMLLRYRVWMILIWFQLPLLLLISLLLSHFTCAEFLL